MIPAKTEQGALGGQSQADEDYPFWTRSPL